MINQKLISIICLSLALASCEAPENLDSSAAKNEAKYMAGITKHEIHTEYLNHYALDHLLKAKGLKHLAQSYVPKKWQQNEEYIQEFGYECEKLGFKEFLQKQNLPCEKLTQSPIFDHQLDAYVVQCAPVGIYNMGFDYDKKQWNVKL
jgi:hypothetical protein